MKTRLLFLVALILYSCLITKAQNIIKAEYFVDVDPGIGAATDLPITASPSLQNIPFNLNVTSLTEGPHQLYFRVKDANGFWSVTERAVF